MSGATLSVLLALVGPTASAPQADDAPPVASPAPPPSGGTARTAPTTAAPPTPRESPQPQPTDRATPPADATRTPDGASPTPTPDDPSMTANPDGGGSGGDAPPGGGASPGGGGAGGAAPSAPSVAAPSGGGAPPTPPAGTPPVAAPSGSAPTPGGGAGIKPLRSRGLGSSSPRLPGSAFDDSGRAGEPRLPGFERDQKNLRDPFESNGPRRVTRVITYNPPPPPPPAPPPQDDDRMFFGGYGGPVGRLSAVSGKVATLAGFEGGVLIGERLSLGGAAYRMTWRHGPPILDEAGNDYSLRMSYGGFNVGVTLWRPSILEFQIESLIGAGMACVSTAGDYDDDSGHCVETVKMFVGEPGATMYINVTDWMRVAITGGYRLVVREAWRPPNEFLLSGGYGGIDLHFGWFRKPPPKRRRR